MSDPHPWIFAWDVSKMPRWSYTDVNGDEYHDILWLYPEPEEMSCLVSWLDLGPDRPDPVRYYLDHLQQSERAKDDVHFKIYWYIAGPETIEEAPYAVLRGAPRECPTDFLDRFSWPLSDQGDRVNWFRLPIHHRFPEFWNALGWHPAPLQTYCPMRVILEAHFGQWPKKQ